MPDTDETVLTGDQLALLREPLLAFVTTLMADGAPHTTLIWADEESGQARFNTFVGSLKERHLRHDPRLSLAIHDPASPWRGVIIRGRAEMGEEGAMEHAHLLAHKYTGQDYPSSLQGVQRVTVRIHADRISPIVHGSQVERWTER
jgi:PPOX class probable F420-dependent enzyme